VVFDTIEATKEYKKKVRRAPEFPVLFLLSFSRALKGGDEKMKRFNDLTGRDFDFLHVDRYVGTTDHKAMFECTCECGNKVIVAGTELSKHARKSCGCKKEACRAASCPATFTCQMCGAVVENTTHASHRKYCQECAKKAKKACMARSQQDKRAKNRYAARNSARPSSAKSGGAGGGSPRIKLSFDEKAKLAKKYGMSYGKFDAYMRDHYVDIPELNY
jgi:hypothetical protein